MNFNFYMPSRVIFGSGSLSKLHQQKLPGKKALIVTGGTSIKKIRIFKKIGRRIR